MVSGSSEQSSVSDGVGSLSGLARGQPPTPEVLVSVNTRPAGRRKIFDLPSSSPLSSLLPQDKTGLTLEQTITPSAFSSLYYLINQ